jgi:hypothetical protein
MINLAAFGLMAGFLLGLRFRVLILGPAMIFATIGTGATGILTSQPPRMIALGVLGILVSLQLGYIIGSVVLAYLPEARPRYGRSRWTASRHFNLLG